MNFGDWAVLVHYVIPNREELVIVVETQLDHVHNMLIAKNPDGWVTSSEIRLDPSENYDRIITWTDLDIGAFAWTTLESPIGVHRYTTPKGAGK